MPTRSRCWIIASSSTFLLNTEVRVALAGMPSLTIDELPKQRLESISFFLVVFLLCALIVRFLWNSLRRDIPLLPKLSYLRAIGLTTLWSLVFVLVLTMISGARELLTPGAWNKHGLTYSLNTVETGRVPIGWDEQTRVRKIDALRVALWDYAQRHDGLFPIDRTTSEIPSDRWECPDVSRMRYLYITGLRIEERQRLLAYEPELYGTDRYVLFCNGDVKRLSAERFAALEVGR